MSTSIKKRTIILSMAQYAALATVDNDIEYCVYDMPITNISSSLMETVILQDYSRMFNDGDVYICSDDNSETYSEGKTYRFTVNGSTKTWEDISFGDEYILPSADSNTLGGVKLGYTTSQKNYAVQKDDNNKLFVNVPWSDSNTTYSAGSGLILSGTTFTPNTSYSTNGKNYKVQVDSATHGLYVNVPWVDTNTIYNHPHQTQYVSGLYKITTDDCGHVTSASAVTKSDITSLGIPGSDTNTTYTAGDGLNLSGTNFTVNTSYVSSGKNYKVQIDSTTKGLYVNVPWTDTNTVYDHPHQTSYASGLYKITTDDTGHITSAIAVTKDDITNLGIPSNSGVTNIVVSGQDGLTVSGSPITSSGTITIGLPPRLDGSNPISTKANDATSQGFYYIGDTDNRPPFKQVDGLTSTDYRILTTSYDTTSWLQQIATDFRSNDVFTRRKQNGVWMPWTALVKMPQGLETPCYTDNTIPKWDASRNATLQSSGITIDDSNNISGIVDITMSGNLNIAGNITQTGTNYETHSEQIYTKDDYIFLRDGATAGLADNAYAGFEAVKYDGTNNGRLVFDNTGTARVGDAGDESPIATRAEMGTFTNRHFVAWGGTGLVDGELSIDECAKLVDIPTTLPASDVYAWAKASSKPSYNYSEIIGTPSLDNYVTLNTSQTISGIKTFSAPTNVSGQEQATMWIKTANGGRVGFGKESGNSGTAIFFDQVEGTRRLNFRASSTAGAIVWSQPEADSCLYMDVANVYFRGCGSIHINSNGIYPATNSTRSIGTSGNRFSTAYINTIYEGTTALSAKYAAINAIPTTLPASDVYAWAKSPNKPSYSYDELTNKPSIPTVPTNVSSFSNDAGYLTSSSLNNYVTLSEAQTISGAKSFTGGNVFTAETKFTHSSYCPTWSDIASGIGKSSCFTRGAFMQMITGQILLANNNYTDTGKGYNTEANKLKFQTMTASSGQPVVTEIASIAADGIRVGGTKVSLEGHAHSYGEISDRPTFSLSGTTLTITT